MTLFDLPPSPVEPRTPAGRRFLGLLRYWSGGAVVEALRWTTDDAADLAWFADIENDPAFSVLDLEAVLISWNDWLLEQYAAKRRDPSRPFVKGWRASLRAALKRALAVPAPTVPLPPPNGVPHEPAARGAWRGASSDYVVPYYTDDELPVGEWDDGG